MTKSEIAISENANCAQNAKKRPNFATKGVYYLKITTGGVQVMREVCTRSLLTSRVRFYMRSPAQEDLTVDRSNGF